MKYIRLIACAFSISAILLVSVFVSNKTARIDRLLEPYQDALTRVNAEIGSALVIPEDAKTPVYAAYRDYTPEEFEEHIKQEYLDSMYAAAADMPIDYNTLTPIEMP